MTKKWNPTTALVALLAAVGVAGAVLLGVALWPENSAEAKQDFCNSLSDFSSTVVSYQGLDPVTATNDEREAAADDIAEAWDNVVDDAYDWANAYDNPLAEAYWDLENAIDGLPSDYTVAEDLDALQPELSAFPQAFHDTFDGSGCTDA
jgi:hypothetical protein